MNKLEKVFEIIGDREWDLFSDFIELEDENFHLARRSYEPVIYTSGINQDPKCMIRAIGGDYAKEFSLADLLANKSFCKALWAVELWQPRSVWAWQILRDEGPDQALDYMIKTAKK